MPGEGPSSAAAAPAALAARIRGLPRRTADAAGRRAPAACAPRWSSTSGPCPYRQSRRLEV